MTAQKTRCPFCESSFAVTTEQLAARGGHVRCGKCFQVFKADDHLVSEESSSTPPPPNGLFDYLDQHGHADSSPDVTLAGQTPEQVAHAAVMHESAIHHAAALDRPSDMDDDFEGLFSSLAPVEIDPDQGYGQHSQSNLTREAAQVALAPVQTPPAVAMPEPINRMAAPIPKNDKPLNPIESLFGDLIDDDDKPTPSNNSGSLKLDSDFSDLFLTGKSMQMDALQRDEIVGVDKLHAGADESWAEALLQDTPPKTAPLAAPNPNTKSAAVANSRSVMPAAQRKSSTPLPHSDVVDDLPVGEQLAGSSSRPSIADDEDLLSYLSRTGAAQGDEMVPLSAPRPNRLPANPSPLPASNRMLTPTKQSVSIGHYISWGLMCLLMVGLLLGQFVYFGFDRLAANPSHYQYMRSLCRIAGCHVPLIDINQIKTSKIIAKRHPNNSKMTRFSLTLSNTAAETQPMPALKLTLLEQGQVTAGRVIQPAEYLQGAAAGLTRLPPNMPVKVHFDIQMPRREIGTFAIDPTY